MKRRPVKRQDTIGHARRRSNWVHAAVSLTMKHLDQAGVAASPALAGANDWSTFAQAVSRSIQPIVDREPDAPWLRALFADLVQFRHFNPGGSARANLAELLSELMADAHGGQQQARIKALLPDEARPALELIDKWDEERQRRIDEAGY